MFRSAHGFALVCVLPLSLLAFACGDGGGGAGTGTATTSSTTTTTGTGGAGGGSGGAGGTSGCVLDPPDTYDGAAYDANAATELAVRGQFFALTSLMQSAEADLLITPTLEELTALYEAGSPSVRSITTAYYDARILDVFAEFAAAAGSTWTPASPPSGPGGKYGSNIFSAYGIDLRQAVEKGLFEAAFYNHALSLLGGPIEEATVDRLLATYGAHPSFPGNSDAADPMTNPNPDRIGAQYAERRSPKDPNDPTRPADPASPGPYFRIKAELIRAKAAIQAGSECDAARDEALGRVMDEWERVMFATVIYYFNDSSLKLTKENPTEADLAGGLHGYGEAIGFIHGFKGMPEDGRHITDAQIDALLALVGAPSDAEATSYQLITDPALTVPNLIAAIDEVATIYGFTPQEVEGFKVNH